MASVDIIYVLFGTFGIILNLTVALIIWFDKSMKNLTFAFMAQLAISDIEVLIGTIVGPAVSSLLGSPQVFGLVRTFVYFNAAGFHVSTYWMVFVACTRWAVFAKNVSVNECFSNNRQYAICFLIWIALHATYSPILFYSDACEPVGGRGAYKYTNGSYSQFLKYFDFCHNHGSLAVQLIFNLASAYCIWQMRKTVISPELKSRNRMEIKLYVQCAIDSIVYAVLQVLFLLALFCPATHGDAMFLAMDVFFFLNHVDCALLYLFFNQRLREILKEAIKKAIPCKNCMETAAAQVIPIRSRSIGPASGLQSGNAS